MSEILSKSMHMPGAGTSPSAVAKTETNSDDFLFAALFGDQAGDISAGDDNGDAAVLAGVFAVQTTEQDDPENPPQEASLAMIAALASVAASSLRTRLRHARCKRHAEVCAHLHDGRKLCDDGRSAGGNCG